MELIKKYEMVKDNCGNNTNTLFLVKYRNPKGKICKKEFLTEFARDEFISDKLKGAFSADGKKMKWSNLEHEYYVP